MKKSNNAPKQKFLKEVAKEISKRLAKKDYKVIKIGLLEQEFAK